MSLISKTISNIVNGVSQQAHALRLPSQAEVQENALSSTSEGLRKRPALTLVKDLQADPAADPLCYRINGGINRRYQVILSDGDLQVYDLSGNPVAVTFPNGKAYLNAVTPATSFQFMPIEDQLFLLNSEVTPELAISPYLSSDRVSAAVSFGNGLLVDDGVQATPNNAQFMAYISTPFTSLSNPYGWVSTLDGAGFTAPVATLDAAVTLLNDWLGTYGALPIQASEFKVQKALGVPVSLPNITQPGTLSLPRTAATGLDEGKNIEVVLPTTRTLDFSGAGLGSHNAVIVLRYYQSPGAPSSSAGLWPDVTDPQGRYWVPGQHRTGYQSLGNAGTITVTVNGTPFTTAISPTMTADEYATHFQGVIAAAFSGYTVTATNTVLNIQAPAGGQLFVTASDSTNSGTIQVEYPNLPYADSVFVVIKEGVSAQTYSVSLNGHVVNYVAGGATDVASYRSDTIAQSLTTSINGLSGFQATQYGNVIRVIRPDGAPITFATNDTWTNEAMYSMKNALQDVADLPRQFIAGFPLRITGVGNSAGYLMHFVQEGSSQPAVAVGIAGQTSATISAVIKGLVTQPAGPVWNDTEGSQGGFYEECAQPGIPDTPIPSSMPHALIINDDGSFTFKEVSWPNRSAGDAKTNPASSFFGQKIKRLFAYKDRLGFLTKQSVVFSRTGKYFNLFAPSARDVYDDDPIDFLVINDEEHGDLMYVAAFNNGLLLCTPTIQFVVPGTQLFTTKTLQVIPTTKFELSETTIPVTAGPNVFLASDQNGFVTVLEYLVPTAQIQNTAADTTIGVQTYIPGPAAKFASSTSEDLLIVKPAGSSKELYVYKYLTDTASGRKIQESWSKWIFPVEIVGCDFVGTELYLVTRNNGRLALEKMQIHAKHKDTNMPIEVLLDRKVFVTGSYDATSKLTTWALPYAVANTDPVAFMLGPDFGDLMGLWDIGNATVTGNSTAVTYPGDYSAGGVYLGVGYTMLYQLSQIFMRDQQGVAIQNSILNLATIEFNHENTGFYQIEVTAKGRPTRVKKLTEVLLGAPSPTTGQLNLVDGSLRASIKTKNKSATVVVRNDSPLPCNLQSFTWEGTYSVRSRRL